MNPTVDVSQLPLRDIHLPAPIGWWPPALGWWLLAALVLAGLVLYAIHYYRARHKRAALRALTRVRTALEQGAEPVACLQFVSTVLRRFAMTSVARARAAVARARRRGPDRRALARSTSTAAGRRRSSARRRAGNCWPRRTRGRTASSASRRIELTALCTAWLAAQPTTNRPRQRIAHVDARLVVDARGVAAAVARAPRRAGRAARSRRGAQGARRRGVRRSRGLARAAGGAALASRGAVGGLDSRGARGRAAAVRRRARRVADDGPRPAACPSTSRAAWRSRTFS